MAFITSQFSGGPWDVGSTWVGGVVPASTDAAIIVASAACGVYITASSGAICCACDISGGASTISRLYQYQPLSARRTGASAINIRQNGYLETWANLFVASASTNITTSLYASGGSQWVIPSTITGNVNITLNGGMTLANNSSLKIGDIGSPIPSSSVVQFFYNGSASFNLNVFASAFVAAGSHKETRFWVNSAVAPSSYIIPVSVSPTSDVAPSSWEVGDRIACNTFTSAGTACIFHYQVTGITGSNIGVSSTYAGSGTSGIMLKWTPTTPWGSFGVNFTKNIRFINLKGNSSAFAGNETVTFNFNPSAAAADTAYYYIDNVNFTQISTNFTVGAGQSISGITASNIAQAGSFVTSSNFNIAGMTLGIGLVGYNLTSGLANGDVLFTDIGSVGYVAGALKLQTQYVNRNLIIKNFNILGTYAGRNEGVTYGMSVDQPMGGMTSSIENLYIAGHRDYSIQVTDHIHEINYYDKTFSLFKNIYCITGPVLINATTNTPTYTYSRLKKSNVSFYHFDSLNIFLCSGEGLWTNLFANNTRIKNLWAAGNRTNFTMLDNNMPSIIDNFSGGSVSSVSGYFKSSADIFYRQASLGQMSGARSGPLLIIGNYYQGQYLPTYNIYNSIDSNASYHKPLFCFGTVSATTGINWPNSGVQGGPRYLATIAGPYPHNLHGGYTFANYNGTQQANYHFNGYSIINSLQYSSKVPKSGTSGIWIDPAYQYSGTTNNTPAVVHIKLPVKSSATDATNNYHMYFCKSSAAFNGRIEVHIGNAFGSMTEKENVVLIEGEDFNLTTYDGTDTGWTDVSVNLGAYSNNNVEDMTVYVWDGSAAGQVGFCMSGFTWKWGIPFMASNNTGGGPAPAGGVSYSPFQAFIRTA